MLPFSRKVSTIPSKPATVSKQVTDKLMQLESASENIQNRLKKLEQEAMIIRDLKNEKRTLLDQVGQLTEQIEMLEGWVKTMSDRLEGGKANGTDSEEDGDASRPSKRIP